MEQLQKHLRIEEETRIRYAKRFGIEFGSKVSLVDVNKVKNNFANKFGNKRILNQVLAMIPRSIRLVSIAKGNGTSKRSVDFGRR